MNGACGGGALVATGVVFEDVDSAAAEVCEPLSDFRYVTICHRFCSERLAQAGIPLLTAPVVMNQKSSPSDADWVGPFDNAGTLPVPRPFAPWQELQLDAYSLDPATAPACCPEYGFFNCGLDRGAL